MPSQTDFQPARTARALYAPLVVALAIAGGYGFGLEIGLLVVAGGVLGGAIWLVWTSLQGLVGEAPLTLDEALSLGAPSAEEEQKRSVLRALKDLEYEREVGKLSDADYESLALHYRNEAKRLLQVVDADWAAERQRAEKLVLERLERTRPQDDETAAGGAEATEAGDDPAAGEESASAGDDDGRTGEDEATAAESSRTSLPTTDPAR